MQWHSVSLSFETHHLGDELASVLDFSVDFVFLYNFQIFVKVLLVHILDLTLELFLFLVYGVEIVAHEIIDIDVVISCALRGFGNSASLVLRVTPCHNWRLPTQVTRLVILRIELVKSVCSDGSTLCGCDSTSF